MLASPMEISEDVDAVGGLSDIILNKDHVL